MSVTPQSLPVSRTTKNFTGDRQLVPIDLSPSRRLAWAQTLALLSLALTAALAVKNHVQEEPLWWLVLGVFWGLLAAGAWSIQMALNRAPSCISYRSGDWYLTLAGVEYPAQLVGEVVVWHALVVARFRLHKGAAKVSLVCLPDSLSRDDFRRLKVWLRIYPWYRKN